MFLSVYHTFYYSSLFICAVVSLSMIKGLSPAFRWLAVLVVLTLVVEVGAKYVAYCFDTSNSAVYHVFTPIEFLFYTLIYALLVDDSKWIKVFWFCWFILVVSEVINTLYVQPLGVSNTNIMMMESVMLVFFSLVLFLKIKESMEYENLLIESVFWFNSIILVYYASNILIWGFHSIKIYNLTDPPTLIYDVNLMLSGILYLVFSFAIYLNYKSSSNN